MIRTMTVAALALALSAPLAVAGEMKAEDATKQQASTKAPTPEELREIGAKRIQAQKDAISSYEVSEDAKPSDRRLVEQLASPETAEILLRKSVNNSQKMEVKEELGVTVEQPGAPKKAD